MNTTQIDGILRGRCAIYKGVYACDELPEKVDTPCVIVANTDPKRMSGEHWVAMYIGARGEYFDSFGMGPSLVFERYMNKNCLKWTFNGRQLQSIISRFCGHYCIMYCVYRNNERDLNQMLKCFTNDTALNDYLVHKFVCKML